MCYWIGGALIVYFAACCLMGRLLRFRLGTMSTCNSCGAEIQWLATCNGKSIPLDVTPAEDGNLVIVDGVARVIKKGQDPQFKVRWKSHFATCPNAARHRRKN